MLLSIHHITEYQFDQPVRYALQRLKLRPKNGAGQTVHDWQRRALCRHLQRGCILNGIPTINGYLMKNRANFCILYKHF